MFSPIIPYGDMTRFGRDHVRVGMYMELFRKHGVRFIAIGHDIDSAIPDSLEFAPFINIMSEWYSRDNSRKLKAVFKAKGNSGKRTTNHAIYGYVKDPNDRTKWIVDEEAAAIIRRIFQMTIEGMGPHQIARQLTTEKIYCPAYYLQQRGQGTTKTKVIDNPYLWRGTSVGGFIEKPEYMGDTVNFRWYKDSYTDRRAKKTPDDELAVFENTHPAIVDRETWHTAQRCRTVVRRTDSLGEANPLTGLLVCAQCGSRMYNRRRPYAQERIAPSGNVYTRNPEDYYNCATNKLAFQNYKSQCTPHYTKTADIKEIVLGVITRISGYVRENESSFVQQVREDSAIKHEATLKSHRKQLAKNEKRYTELDNIIRGLYEDKHNGVLTAKRFETLATGYEDEQEKLEQQIQELQAEIETFNKDSDKADKFMGSTKDENQHANDLIKTYGIERVEWVLAVTVANGTSEHLSNHKKWASQKELPSEPCNFSAQSGDEIANISLSNLIRTVQLKSAELLWDSGQANKLSYEDRNAVAQIKADRYLRENPSPAEVEALFDKMQQKPRPVVSRPAQKQKNISYERD